MRGFTVPNPKSGAHTTKRGLKVPNPKFNKYKGPRNKGWMESP